VSVNFQIISNLHNISKILEKLFLTRLRPYIASLPSFNHPQSAYRKHPSNKTSLIHLLDSIYHAADNGLATLLSLSLPLDLSAAFGTIDHTIILNRLTSSFGIMGSSYNCLSPISPTDFLSHFRLLFLFHITFILWCSPTFCLGSHPLHNLCHTYCFNLILSWCQSTAIWMLTSHSLWSSFPLQLYLAVSAASSGVSLLFTAGSSTMIWL